MGTRRVLSRRPLNMLSNEITPFVMVAPALFAGILSLAMIGFLMARINGASRGTGVQCEIADQIAEGASSFLITEYKCLLPFVIVVGAFIVGLLESQDTADDMTTKGGWQTMLCFFCGAILSAAAGWFGMKVATDTNVKTMEAAKLGISEALRIAFSGGAVMGFTVVGFGLLGVTLLF